MKSAPEPDILMPGQNQGTVVPARLLIEEHEAEQDWVMEKEVRLGV